MVRRFDILPLSGIGEPFPIDTPTTLQKGVPSAPRQAEEERAGPDGSRAIFPTDSSGGALSQSPGRADPLSLQNLPDETATIGRRPERTPPPSASGSRGGGVTKASQVFSLTVA